MEVLPSRSETLVSEATRLLPSAGVPVTERVPMAASSTLATAVAVGLEATVSRVPSRSV